MKFVGIDLGWQTGPSGLCCLESRFALEESVSAAREDVLTLSKLTRRDTLEEVLAWLDEVVPFPEPAMVAVDAPLLIPNETGMRSPDRLAHKYFGKYHAGCYPANLTRPFAARLIQFGRDLESRGFRHAPKLEPKVQGRYQIEAFPHPATVQLFNLPQILKYKKGRLAERAEALGQLRSYLLNSLPLQNPPLEIVSLPPIPSGGKALKALEDRLDSVVCAYVGAHWWYWGRERNKVLGSLIEGYIVVPAPLQAPIQ